MSNSDIRVVPGPANYFSHNGSLAHLHDFTATSSLPAPSGSTASAPSPVRSPSCRRRFTPSAPKVLFSGHCSESDVAQLVAEAGDDRAVVIGVGGGALLDTAKAVARRLGLPVVAIPTIAATCAAWTPLSVWYNDAGRAAF